MGLSLHGRTPEEGAQGLEGASGCVELEQPGSFQILQAEDRAPRGEALQLAHFSDSLLQELAQEESTRLLAVGREVGQIVLRHRMHAIR